jgi:CubicO group peptidase (beta-lactamase class C family)
MKRLVWALCLLSACSQAASEVHVDAKTKEALARAVNAFAESAPGGGVAAALIYPDPKAKDGWGRSDFFAGYTAKKNSPPPNAKTVFMLASVSKVITSALLEKYVAEGKIAFDDKVQKYLPADVRLPIVDGREMTVLDLANHTSGLPRQVRPIPKPYNYQPQDFFKWLKRVKLEHAPGKTHVYSNAATGLLGYVLGEVSHKTLDQAAQDDLLAPLGMVDTRIYLSAEQEARKPSFFDVKGKQVPTNCCRTLPTLGGGGAFKSTLDDMVRFVTYSMTAKHPEAAKFDLGPQSSVNLGWYKHPLMKGRKDLTVIDKNGGMGSATSYIAYVPETRVGVVVLVNSKTPSTPLGMQMLRIAHKKRADDHKKEEL